MEQPKGLITAGIVRRGRFTYDFCKTVAASILPYTLAPYGIFVVNYGVAEQWSAYTSRRAAIL